MPAQQRESRKNYIGILSDRIEEQRVIDQLTKTDRRVKHYFKGLVAAVLPRRRGKR